MAGTTPQDEAAGAEAKPAIVKKYANRRLYNTQTSSYVTLDELCRMVRDGQDFVVYDAKTGEDITRSVLTQIILEEDSKGRNLLPIRFLRQLIGFYDDGLHTVVPRYLELSMENFARHQDQMRTYLQGTFGRLFPFEQFDELARQNMALFQQAAKMWSPFTAHGEAARPPAEPPVAEPATGAQAEDVRELKRAMEEMRKEIARLSEREPSEPRGR
jgi:polyhydroxyalkanoate synthesis repressor PhaR